MQSLADLYKFFRSQFSVATGLLSLFWLSGIMLGYGASTDINSLSVSMMHAASLRSVSIVGVFFPLFFPLLITFVVNRFLKPHWILPVVFTKAFCFCFCSCTCIRAFGSAGWLIKCLFLFSDSIGILVLLWLWLSILHSDCKIRPISFAAASFILLAVSTLDYYVIAPFTVLLFNK